MPSTSSDKKEDSKNMKDSNASPSSSSNNNHNLYDTKPVTVDDVVNELYSKNIFDDWCERLNKQFESSELFQLLLGETDKILEEALKEKEGREIPTVHDLLKRVDNDSTIQRKIKCWIHRNLYPNAHSGKEKEQKNLINPKIAKEIEETIENCVSELQGKEFDKTNKIINREIKQKVLEKQAKEYKTLTTNYISAKENNSTLNNEFIEELKGAKSKRLKEGGNEPFTETNDIEYNNDNGNFVDEVFPMKKRKFHNPSSSTLDSSSNMNNETTEITNNEQHHE
ncbi:hypothetical protein ABK040_006328 [Willaertia magna]